MVVFGASNFPLAFSPVGGATAKALEAVAPQMMLTLHLRPVDF